MTSLWREWSFAALGFLAVAAPGSAEAGAVLDWEPSIVAFSQAESDTRPPTRGVVFVGSSSFRLWSDLESQFEPFAAINRGFGGSRLSDCVRYLDTLVLKHRPSHVVVYAGDNDLAAGRSPEQVLGTFSAFYRGVHAQLPNTEVTFVSIKPSPARVHLLESIRLTNKLIAEHVAGVSYLSFVDVFTPMLDEQGQPRAELFLDDALHLNAQGYQLWHELIAHELDGEPSRVPEAVTVTDAGTRISSTINTTVADGPVEQAQEASPRASPGDRVMAVR